MRLVFSLIQTKNNYFFVISDNFGTLFYSGSLGKIGVKNISKREVINALKLIRISIFKIIKKYSEVKISAILKLEGIKKAKLKQFYFYICRILLKNKVTVNSFAMITKKPFNGCRNPK